jgi:hypothetical protein
MDKTDEGMKKPGEGNASNKPKPAQPTSTQSVSANPSQGQSAAGAGATVAARETATTTYPVEGAAPGERQFLRFTRLNRALHIFLIMSFLTLALTGLTLKFSYTGWAVVLSHLLGGFESAGYLHRFAAVIMFAVFTIHVTDVLRMKKRKAAAGRR